MPNPCSPFFLQVEAVIWQDGQVQELPPFPGDPDGFASAVNDKGQVAGFTGCVTGDIHAVLWQHSMPNDLGNLGGVTGNFPNNINNQGQVVGQSDLPGDTTHHAFFWTKHDGMRDLGLLPGDVNSLAASINNKTQVVGKSDDPSGNSRAFLWQNGVMTDMNTLIPANFPLYLIEALGINDRGQITGYAVVIATGEFHGFLGIPCDEQHADKEGCEDGTGSATPIAGENSERPKIALPEGLRQRLQSRPGFGGFGAGPMAVSRDHQDGAALDAETQCGKSASSFVLPEDRLWPGERGAGQEAQFRGFWAPHCEVGANNRLTGICKGERGPKCQCRYQNEGFPFCTKGDRAKAPGRNQYSCGLVDLVHPCPLH
jgi:probable HAF family extracellular repeat protein